MVSTFSNLYFPIISIWCTSGCNKLIHRACNTAVQEHREGSATRGGGWHHRALRCYWNPFSFEHSARRQHPCASSRRESSRWKQHNGGEECVSRLPVSWAVGHKAGGVLWTKEVEAGRQYVECTGWVGKCDFSACTLNSERCRPARPNSGKRRTRGKNTSCSSRPVMRACALQCARLLPAPICPARVRKGPFVSLWSLEIKQ